MREPQEQNDSASALRVLFIEDDPTYAEMLRERLSAFTDPPFHVNHAGRLQSGLDCLKREKIDAVLLDLFLPDAQGLETFRRLQRREPLVPVVWFLPAWMMSIWALRRFGGGPKITRSKAGQMVRCSRGFSGMRSSVIENRSKCWSSHGETS